MFRRVATPALLVALVILFHWKLTLTSEYVWFDHSDMVYLEIPACSSKRTNCTTVASPYGTHRSGLASR